MIRHTPSDSPERDCSMRNPSRSPKRSPVAAGERVSALAVLRAAGPDYDLPWASRCATCHALLALGERYAGEEFEFGAGPAAGMAGDVALGALAEAFLLEDALCLSNDVLLGEPTRALYPVPPPLLRCLAHADWRPFLPGDPRYAAIRSCAPKKLRRTLAQIDGLLRRKDAPPPLSPVAAVDLRPVSYTHLTLPTKA